MKRILIVLVALFVFIGCKTKNVHVSKSQETTSKEAQKQKDSLFDTQNHLQKTAFEFSKNQLLELELESDTLKGKSLIFEKSVTPTGSKYIISGGKVRLKVGSSNRQFHSQNSIHTHQKGNIHTEENNKEQQTQSQVFKDKKVEVKGVSFGFYFWILILIIGAFIAWKYKLFRWFK